MDLGQFLKKETVKPVPVSAEPSEAEHLNSDSDSPAQVVYSDTTPSGIQVEYQPGPPRLYRVNGAEVPSVTTVLDCLRKDGLSWWGQGIGIDGVMELVRRGLLVVQIDWAND